MVMLQMRAALQVCDEALAVWEVCPGRRVHNEAREPCEWRSLYGSEARDVVVCEGKMCRWG